MAKRTVNWRIHTGLLDRLKQRADHEERTPNSLIEQALAEFLHVPLADRSLPEQPVELCPQCQRGVINQGQCHLCRWHRVPRKQSQPRAGQTRDAENPKYKKWAKLTT